MQSPSSPGNAGRSIIEAVDPADAFIESATVAAAHRTVVSYFPAHQNDLDGMYTMPCLRSMHPMRNPGVDVAEAAAAALTAARYGNSSTNTFH